VSLPHLRFGRGGEAAVTAFDGDRITVLSTVPSAPGSRPEGALPSGALVRIKVARCRRQDEGFVLEGRLLDATREVRAEIVRLLAPGESIGEVLRGR
jgi:hypothetical protein